MLKSYLIVAVRNLLRHKLYSLINLAGLSVGLTGALLVLLYVQRELSYDRHHEKAERIYRVLRETRLGNGRTEISMPGTSGALVPALSDDFPQIEEAVRVHNRWRTWVGHGDKGFYQHFCVADSNLFEVFTLPLVRGDPKTILRQPYSVLITESAAVRYFGDEDPIGKIVVPENRPLRADYVVAGIMRDLPETAFFRFSFDFLTFTRTPITETGWHTWLPEQFRIMNSYILLPEGYDARELEGQLAAFTARHMGAEIAARHTYRLQPLTRVHLYSREDYGVISSEYGDVTQLYLLSAVALLVLLIACTNFAGLTTARSAQRVGEVGVRKAVGARREHVASQFLGESLLLALLALLAALGMLNLLLPAFNSVLELELTLDTGSALSLLPGSIGIALLVGLLSGLYPALYLSAFRPTDVLKGSLPGGDGTGKGHFRKSLVILQVALSTLLIVGTAVVYRQLTYIQARGPGFDRDNFVVIWPRMGNDVDAVKQIYLAHPDILAATATWDPMYDAGMQEIYALKEKRGRTGTCAC